MDYLIKYCDLWEWYLLENGTNVQVEGELVYVWDGIKWQNLNEKFGDVECLQVNITNEEILYEDLQNIIKEVIFDTGEGLLTAYVVIKNTIPTFNHLYFEFWDLCENENIIAFCSEQ